jgi:hypothetical protein
MILDILELYLAIGLLWTVYIFYKLTDLRKSQQEYWFPVILFSLTLWPFFMLFNYERGELFKK